MGLKHSRTLSRSSSGSTYLQIGTMMMCKREFTLAILNDSVMEKNGEMGEGLPLKNFSPSFLYTLVLTFSSSPSPPFILHISYFLTYNTVRY